MVLITKKNVFPDENIEPLSRLRLGRLYHLFLLLLLQDGQIETDMYDWFYLVHYLGELWL